LGSCIGGLFLIKLILMVEIPYNAQTFDPRLVIILELPFSAHPRGALWGEKRAA